MRLLSFPTYETPIGAEIGRALHGERDYGAGRDAAALRRQPLRVEAEIERELAAGTVLVCDRYLASSIAYGEAQGLDPRWLAEIQTPLPQPDLTVLLDMAPDVSLRAQARRTRQVRARSRSCSSRVRASYLRQAREHGWTMLDADARPRVVAADVQ